MAKYFFSVLQQVVQLFNLSTYKLWWIGGAIGQTHPSISPRLRRIVLRKWENPEPWGCRCWLHWRVTRRQREGRTSNPGVLSGGDVSSWSFFAMSWGTDLWVSALFPFLAPCGLLFTNKQLGFWHDFRKGVLVRLPVYSRSVLLVYKNTFAARNNARVWYIIITFSF